MLDELGLDRQAALELKLEAGLHQKILQLAERISKDEIKIRVKGVGQECPTHTATAGGPMRPLDPSEGLRAGSRGRLSPDGLRCLSG